MNYEIDEWTPLSSEQTKFFAGQVVAATQIAFGPTAQEAGIVPMNGQGYGMKVGATDYRTLQWPDPYRADTSCILATAKQPGTIISSAFVRVTEMPESYGVQGVALDGTGYMAASNLYGEQLVLRDSLPDQSSRGLVGLSFLATAHNVVRSQRHVSSLAAAPIETLTASMTGIESGVTVNLFRSLNSLGANLVVGGAMVEHYTPTSHAYDLVRTLWKMKANDMATGNSAASTAVLNANGKISGVAYESEQHGLVIVRQLLTFPATISLTVAARPRPDEVEFFATQYRIQASGTSVDVMSAPAESHSTQGLLPLLAGYDNVLRQGIIKNEAYLPAGLAPEGQHILEQIIIQLIGERGNQLIA